MTPQISIQPHGGTLIDRVLTGAAAAEARATAANAPRVTLSEVGIADLEMIATGAYSPLTGFLGQADYTRVVNEMRLADGTLWSIPITLPVSESRAEMLREGSRLACTPPMAGWSACWSCASATPTTSATRPSRSIAPPTQAHPGVARLYSQGPVLLGGDVWLLEQPTSAFPELAFTPAASRAGLRRARLEDGRRLPDAQPRPPRARVHPEVGAGDRRRPVPAPAGRRDQG